MMKMKYILLLAVSALGSMPAVAQNNYPTAPKTSAILIDSHGAEKGTSANPIVVSGSTGGSGGSTPTGTAGSPNAAVVTVQGIASATPIKVDASATTQPISAATLPLPAGAATANGVAAIGTSLSTIGGQLPASLGAKTGAASLSITPASDLANLEPGGSPITGQAMPAGGLGLTGWMSAIYKATVAPLVAGTAHIGSVAVDDVADAAVTSGSATSAAMVVSASTAGFAGGSIQINGIGAGNTIVAEQSDDGSYWLPLPVSQITNVANPAPSTSMTVTGIYGFITPAAFVRVRVSTYGSGTVAVVMAQKRAVSPYNNVSLSGGTASIGAVTGNLNTATGYSDSTTALGAAATFTGTGRAFNSTFGPQYSFYNAQAQADQAGTLYIEVSYDSGTTYIPVQSVTATAVTNAAGTTYYVAQARAPLTGPFSSAELYRVVYKNGATAQATFRITSSFTAG